MIHEQRTRERITSVDDLVRERATHQIRQRHAVADISATGAHAGGAVDVGVSVPVSRRTDGAAPMMRELGVTHLGE